MCAGAQRAIATTEPSRQTARPAREIRRGRWAARVYSSTKIATSVTVGCSAATGAEAPDCTPKMICAAPMVAATANAATGYRRRGITVAASSRLTAIAVSHTLGGPAESWPTLNANSTTASSPSACHG